MIRPLVILLLTTLPAFAATRTVGSGQTYSTIGAALTAAASGDTIQIFPGTYPEVVSWSGKHNLTIFGTDRDTVLLNPGRIEVGGTNTFIHSLTVRDWTGDGNDGIACESLNFLTVSNVVTLDTLTNAWGNTRSHIRARNSAGTKILNCIITGTVNQLGSGYQTGAHIVSGISADGGYGGGSLIRGCTITGLEADGISIHGEWMTIELNTISDCIGTNVANHADGIAFIKSVVDGLTNCNHVRFDRNIIRNTTQNIWVEGFVPGSGGQMRDIWITRNVSYMTAGTVNGRDLDVEPLKNLAIIGGDGVYVYNNFFGRAGGGNSVLIQDSVDRSVLVKGNIIFNDGPNTGTFGMYVETAADVGNGDLNYNIYHTTSGNGLLKVGSNNMNTLSAMQAQGFEANGIVADPKVNAPPTPTLQATSPCIDTSFTPGGSPYWTVDLAGTTAPVGAGWDIGAYEYTAGGGGGAAGLSRWPYTIFGRMRGR